MESRIIQSKTGYIVNRLNQGSNLIKGVVEKLINEGSWKKVLEGHQKSLQVNKEQLLMCRKEQLRKLVTEADTKMWKEEMEKKSSLYLYRARKDTIKEERYGNNKESDIWFRARTNCLDLDDKKWKELNSCRLCGVEKEDLIHFLLICETLQQIRARSILLQRPHTSDATEQMGDFLFEYDDMEERKALLFQMWNARTNFLKQLHETEGSA